MNSLLKLLLSALVIVSFVGCVGTVQEAAVPKTSIATEPRSVINFDGVFKVDPISQDKFEVFFRPAKGGSGKYTYVIYVGDNPDPVTVPSEVLLEDYQGYLKYTLTGLETGKSYDIKVEAEDQLDGAKDNNNVTKIATTFLNLVADFPGIASLSNTSGVDGLDSIKVRWSHATVDAGSIVGSVTDPISYEIVAVDSDHAGLTPDSFDNLALLPIHGRFVKSVAYDPLINEAILRGLRSDTKYYVRVRAIHKNSSIIHGPDPRLRSELNSKYRTISTLSDDLSKIDFKVSGLEVSRNEGIAQYTSLVLSWPVASGVFDHFRVYYAQDSSQLSFIDTTECLAALSSGCKKYMFNSTGAIIPNLEENKNFYFRLLVCQREDCAYPNYIMGDIRSGSTKPLIASFSGLSGIRAATKVSEVGKIFLTFSMADFREGDFSGYHISYRPDLNTEPEIITATDYAGELKYDAFDYRTATSIVISNIDYSSGREYCFSVYPFVYDPNEPSGYKSYDNGIEKCIKPEIIIADMNQFEGLDSAEVLANDILLTWTPASIGIFDLYQIYLLKTETDGKFSFDKARLEYASANYSNYDWILVNGAESSYRLSNLPNGKYQVGILTYFAYLPPVSIGTPTVYESENNEGLFTCTVNGVNRECVPGI